MSLSFSMRALVLAPLLLSPTSSIMAATSSVPPAKDFEALKSALKDMPLPSAPVAGAEKSPPKLGLTDQQKKGREDVINTCEKAYANARQARPKIDPNLKKPSFLSSSKTKEAYERQYYGLKFFDSYIKEMAVFMNQKITLRRITDERELSEKMREFSSNCGRWGVALVDFAKWVETGELRASKGMEESLKKTYKAWIDTAKKDLKK